MSGMIENDPEKVGSVAAWQNILNGCGYIPPLIITGSMDEKTIETTKRFQEDLGLLVTDTVTLETWQAGLKHNKKLGWSNITPPIQRTSGEVFISTDQILKTLRIVAPNARKNYLDAILQGDQLFRQHDITTSQRMAHFLAQAMQETGAFTVMRENMNYSESRLLEIFGVGNHSANVTRDEARRLAHHPEAIAERVYGLGNPRKARELGNTEEGDGFKYRGNGILQTTGRGNHRRMGNASGVDFEGNPNLVTAPEHALKPALQEWTEGNLNALADTNDIRGITRRINGGFNGFEKRKEFFGKLLPLLQADS